MSGGDAVDVITVIGYPIYFGGTGGTGGGSSGWGWDTGYDSADSDAEGSGGDDDQPTQRELDIDEVQQLLADAGGLNRDVLDRMHELGLNLADIIPPGIYQASFNVEIADINSPGEHNQFLLVRPDGSASIISGNGEGTLEVFDVPIGANDGNPHSPYNERFDDNALVLDFIDTGAQDPDTVWSQLQQRAQDIADADLEYSWNSLNSNSLFATLADSLNLGVDLSWEDVAHGNMLYDELAGEGYGWVDNHNNGGDTGGGNSGGGGGGGAGGGYFDGGYDSGGYGGLYNIP